MSLIIPRNFKRAKAQDAQDAQGDEVIAQKNGYKLVHNTLNDGYWFYTKSGAGWGITATNKVAAVNEFNRLVDSAQDAADAGDAVARNAASDELNVGDKIWITQYGRNYPYTITKKWKEGWTFWYKAKNDKSGKEEIVAEAFANALDDAAQDAKFKVGEEVRVGNPHLADRGRYGRVVSAGVGGNPLLYDVDLGGGVQLFSESDLVAADSRAADACGTDANFKKGDKVRVKTAWAGTRKGIVKEVINDPALKKAYVVEIEGAETFAYPAEIVSADACEDSSELNNDASHFAT